MRFFNVEIQSGTGFEFKNEFFTVTVEAEGFDQAARRGIRSSVARAAEWNAEHLAADTLRLAVPEAYRAVGVRAEMPEFGSPRKHFRRCHVSAPGDTARRCRSALDPRRARRPPAVAPAVNDGSTIRLPSRNLFG